MSETKETKKNKETITVIGVDPGSASTGYGSVSFDPWTRRYIPETAHFSSFIFPMPEDCKARREARCRRRNLVRKKMRVDLVKEMFRPAIDKIDPLFFKRLENSPLLLEDKDEELTSKYILFSDPDFTDKDFFRLYPTVYHLRQACLNGDVHDPRFLFLACLSIIKHPGHFLNKGVSSDSLDDDITDDLETVLKFFCEDEKIDGMMKDPKILSILVSKAPYKKKKEKTESQTTNGTENVTDPSSDNAEKAEPEKKDVLKEFLKAGGAKAADKIASAIRSGSLNCKALFGKPEYNDVKLDFNADDIDARLEEASKILEAEEYDVAESLGALYSWALLKRILVVSRDRNTDICRYASTISEAKVAGHEEYNRHLKMLKHVLRSVLTEEEYEDFFYGKNRYGYSYYAGSIHNNGQKAPGRQLNDDEKKKGISSNDDKKSSQELFYNKCKEYLTRVSENNVERSEIEALINEKSFLIPPRTKLNAAIPHQIQEKELAMILEKQKANFPFLSDKDESGLTVCERIMAIAFWRIPYWAGPLGVNTDPDAQNHSWAVRKKQGAIRPWNFEEMIDVGATITAFIGRQAGRCTYFPDRMVMASSTIIYSAYMVLNELNKVRVRGNFLTVSQKQEIFTELFCNRDKVSLSAFVKYINDRPEPWFEGKVEAGEVTGLVRKDEFSHSMKSYRFFRPYIEKGQLTLKEADGIIELLTIFPESTSALDDRLQKVAENKLGADDLKAIKRFRCSGWGRFSRHYLTGLKSSSPEFPNERLSFMKLMWETNHNQMELMSSQYDFVAAVPEKGAITSVAEAREYLRGKGVPAHVVGAFTNAFACAIKEMDWCDEHYPDKGISACYIESPRFDGVKGKTPDSRKKKLARFYDSKKNKDIKGALIALLNQVGGTEEDFNFVAAKFASETEASLRKDLRYMYYLQLGRCMYTGVSVDLENQGDGGCDREHIYPESKTGLNSRNLVLVKKDANSNKSDTFPIATSIQEKMTGFWKGLVSLKLLDPAVYEKLTRTTPLTPEELQGFRDSHLNMTSWTTLLLKDILEQYVADRYGKKAFPILFVQSGDVFKLRNEIKVPKCRDMNDQHHAVDAFLACVTGRTLYTYYSAAYTEKKRTGEIPKENNDCVTMKEPFKQNIWGAWAKYDPEKGIRGTRDSVRRIAMNVKNFSVIYKKTYGHGQFHDVLQKGKGGGSMIPQKSNHPVILRRIQELMEQDDKMTAITAREIAEKEWTDKYGGYNSLATSHFVKYMWSVANETNVGLYPVPIIRKKEFDNDEALITAIRKELPQKQRDGAVIKILDRCVKKGTEITVNGHPCMIGGRSGKKLLIYNKTGILELGNSSNTLKLQSTLHNVEKYMMTRQAKREVDPVYDKLEADDVSALFEAFLAYINTEEQKKRPVSESVRKALADTETKTIRDAFKDLTLTKRVELLRSIEMYLSSGSKSQKCNLEILGKGSALGSMGLGLDKCLGTFKCATIK